MTCREALTIFALFGNAACSSMAGYRVGFSGEQSGYRQEDTPSIFILPRTNSLERTLDVDARRMVEGALRQMGYTVTTDDKAAVYLVVEAWIETRDQKSTASLIQPASVRVITEPGGTARTIRTPEHTLAFPFTVKFRYPRMSMLVVDGHQFRTSSDVRILWRGDTVLSKGDMLLNEAIPYLVFPLITSFGIHSKGIVQVEVSREQAMGFK